MQSVINKLLVRFDVSRTPSKISTSISNNQGVQSSSFNQAQVTLLQNIKHSKSISVDGTVDDIAEDCWCPCIWQDLELITTILKRLSTGQSAMDFISIGEYSSLELWKLAQEGRIAPNINFSKSVITKHLSVSVRFSGVADIILPDQQGFGHLYGAQIAIIPTNAKCFDSKSNYNEVAIHGAIPGLDRDLFLSETIPDNAIGGLLPVGFECRQRAVVWSTKHKVDNILQKVAHDHGIEYVRIKMTCNEMDEWDWDQSLP